jgi:hypothetical protein
MAQRKEERFLTKKEKFKKKIEDYPLLYMKK